MFHISEGMTGGGWSGNKWPGLAFAKPACVGTKEAQEQGKYCIFKTGQPRP